MKEYDEVKKVAEQTLYEMIKTINNVLDNEETGRLCMELAMTLFASTLDFGLPKEEFVEELNKTNINFSLSIIEHVMKLKEAIDKGEI